MRKAKLVLHRETLLILTRLQVSRIDGGGLVIEEGRSVVAAPPLTLSSWHKGKPEFKIR